MDGRNDTEESDRKALFFTYVQKRMASNARIREEREIRKEDGNEAQSFGIVLKDVDYAISAMEAQDKGKVEAKFLAEYEILQWLGIVEGGQSDLFKNRAPLLEKAEKEGELAGLAGRERKSPYAPASDEDTHWMSGYDKGQRFMRENMQVAMERANDAKAKAEKAVIIKKAAPKAGKDASKPTPATASAKGVDNVTNFPGEKKAPPAPPAKATKGKKTPPAPSLN